MAFLAGVSCADSSVSPVLRAEGRSAGRDDAFSPLVRIAGGESVAAPGTADRSLSTTLLVSWDRTISSSLCPANRRTSAVGPACPLGTSVRNGVWPSTVPSLLRMTLAPAGLVCTIHTGRETVSPGLLADASGVRSGAAYDRSMPVAKEPPTSPRTNIPIANERGTPGSPAADCADTVVFDSGKGSRGGIAGLCAPAGEDEATGTAFGNPP